MFFPKLRKNAKWVFLFLALVFALGFVGFGVGAGGVGIGDVFRGASGDSGVPSLDSAREKVNESPNDPQAFRDLATAAQAEQETDEAIEALEGYIALKPKDTDALRELAGMYLVQVDEARRDYQIAELRSAYLGTSGAVFQSIDLGGPLDADPISNAVSAFYATDLQTALSQAQEAASSAVATYRKIAAQSPNDPNVQLELADAARNAGDTATAIAAYEKYLDLVPANDPTAREVERLLKQIRAGSSG